MLTREFTQAGTTTRVSVTRVDAGWTIRAERDNATVRQVSYDDWHRVERALQAFALAADDAPARSVSA
jgi:hypothetical protein